MQSAITQFLRYLATERNASDLTIKAYREDLFAMVEWFRATRGKVPKPESLSPQELRTFQAALQEAGYARTTIARKLASLRSFYRFAMRQGTWGGSRRTLGLAVIRASARGVADASSDADGVRVGPPILSRIPRRLTVRIGPFGPNPGATAGSRAGNAEDL